MSMGVSRASLHESNKLHLPVPRDESSRYGHSTLSAKSAMKHEEQRTEASEECWAYNALSSTMYRWRLDYHRSSHTASFSGLVQTFSFLRESSGNDWREDLDTSLLRCFWLGFGFECRPNRDRNDVLSGNFQKPSSGANLLNIGRIDGRQALTTPRAASTIGQ